MASNTQMNTSMPDSGAKKYLALGDSYTIGTAVAEAERYPVQTAVLLKAQGMPVKVDIIAMNGWTSSELLYAVKEKAVAIDYDAVSLLIGVNNQYQGKSIAAYKEDFTLLLERAIQLANGKADHVFVLSIPDYSVTPFATGSNRQKIATEIDAFNVANKLIADDLKVHYLDVTTASRKAANDPSLVAADGLHFSGKEYSDWAFHLAAIMKVAL